MIEPDQARQAPELHMISLQMSLIMDDGVVHVQTFNLRPSGFGIVQHRHLEPVLDEHGMTVRFEAGPTNMEIRGLLIPDVES